MLVQLAPRAVVQPVVSEELGFALQRGVRRLHHDAQLAVTHDPEVGRGCDGEAARVERACGATVRGMYGTPEAGTRTAYAQ